MLALAESIHAFAPPQFDIAPSPLFYFHFSIFCLFLCLSVFIGGCSSFLFRAASL